MDPALDERVASVFRRGMLVGEHSMQVCSNTARLRILGSKDRKGKRRPAFSPHVFTFVYLENLLAPCLQKVLRMAQFLEGERLRARHSPLH